MKAKVTKPITIKKGKEVFGNLQNFNMWLNTESIPMGCKPMTIWETGKIKPIYDELVRMGKGI